MKLLDSLIWLPLRRTIQAALTGAAMVKRRLVQLEEGRPIVSLRLDFAPYHSADVESYWRVFELSDTPIEVSLDDLMPPSTHWSLTRVAVYVDPGMPLWVTDCRVANRRLVSSPMRVVSGDGYLIEPAALVSPGRGSLFSIRLTTRPV
jgi:hypothetical protein